MKRPFVGIGFLSVLALFAACEDEGGHVDEAYLESQAPKPKIDLKNATSTLAQTSTRAWSLSKIGAIDETASTITWSINATQSATSARRLVVTGHVVVRNTGAVSAPIGNVVVRLQSKSGSTWTTRSADVANATNGDAATAAQVVTGNTVTTISENAASGPLTVAISPTVVVGANSTVTLPFTASFNNDLLGIAAGTTVRAEILVTFGNAGGGNNPTSVDINGNGVIDTTEARVDGVATLLGDKVVPAPAPVTTAVTLTDTLADITTTGTASFENAVFNIGATTGTVQVTYDGGLAGGTIKNCAHLTGTGTNLEACDERAIARAPWETGDFVTYPQEAWGTPGSAAAGVLLTNYTTVYPSSFFEVGVPGAGKSIILTGTVFVMDLLPTFGPIAPLLIDETNLPATTSGTFGGDVIALKLDVDFSDAGVLGGALDIPFGDLVLCGVPSLPNLDNMSVRQFLGEVNSLLGGGTAIYSLNQLAGTTDSLSNAFAGGVVSDFANDHLFYGSCP